MRFSISISSIVLFILFITCHSDQAKLHAETITKNKTISIFSITDTLNKYLNADSFLNYSNRKIYDGKIENIQVGFENINDSITYFYQLENYHWVKEDSFNYGVIFITPEDLNGDKYKDIIATNNFTASGGNWENIVFLFDPVQNRFHHNRHFDLPNIHYDSITQLIQSPWRGGPYSAISKSTYSLSGDSLKFQDEIIYIPFDAFVTGIVQLEYYKNKNNKRQLTHKISGKGEKLYDIFTNTLWESSHDF